MNKQQAATLYCVAVLIRLTYVALVAFLGGDFANGSDSGKFIKRALSLLEHGEIVYLHYGIWIPDTARMPIYPYFLAGILGLGGADNLWIVGVAQAFIDGSTVIAIALAAAAIDKRWALPAALLGCAWMTLIIYSSFVLSDTIFTAFFCWGLCACMWAPKRNRPVIFLTLAGVAFSCALLTRPMLLLFPYPLVPLVTYLLVTVARVKWPRALMLASIPSLCMILVLIPRIISINSDYGTGVVTTQTGNHALDVVDQFLRLCPACVSLDTESRMHRHLADQLAQLTEDDGRNPVIVDQIRKSVAFEFLKDIPISTIFLGTAAATFRSSVQTGLYETGHQMRWDPPYFSSVSGKNLKTKAANFLNTVKTDKFLIIWLVAQTVALTTFVVQCLGVVTGISNASYRPYVLILLCIAVYFLALNGPFGNPRYGMPLTPILVILTTCGLFSLRKFAQRQTKIHVEN
ncbi:MAG: hypothetical protein CMM32_00160 [Rhodospirillaceae bacterium]|nr:hypothetical protein [Rhodospirillaceae bacterium]|tara:strand:- start:2741 stop:4120 length:1380 start_codon:yes stop_codon:yes gene_type:complete